MGARSAWGVTVVAVVVGCGTPMFDADTDAIDGAHDPDGAVVDAGPRFDAGFDAYVDPCSLCSAREECCDGVCVDTTADPLHCSACGVACPGDVNGAPACVASECALACHAGFADCTPGDGCETDVTTLTDCTECGVACGDYPSTTATCTPSGCAYACTGTHADCDATTPECETDTSSSNAHCGTCGRACAPDQVCTGGSCGGWRPLSTVGAPSPRYLANAVWTGTEMIVWGGVGGEDRAFLSSGGIYDPATDTWRSMAPSRQARILARAVWTGTQLVVFGGRTATDTSVPPSGDGEVYDLASDTWTDLALTRPPSARFNTSAVWTGTEMILWGGATSALANTSTGARWSPGDTAWRATPSTTLSPRASPGGVWTGTSYVVFGGTAAGGALFDPTTSTWHAMATLGAPAAHEDHVFAWVPSAACAVEWSMEGAGRYDPATNTWSSVAPFLSARVDVASTATDDAVFIWGGFLPSGLLTNDGAMYYPAADTWHAVSTDGAPTPRQLAATVWTGTEVLVFGGAGDLGDLHDDGAAYTP